MTKMYPMISIEYSIKYPRKKVTPVKGIIAVRDRKVELVYRKATNSKQLT